MRMKKTVLVLVALAAMAVATVRANKLRSVLTMLGIIIGVGAVIALIGIGMDYLVQVLTRYRQEFLAELYGMTPSEQLHHATGVLSRIWTLRVALNDPARLLPKEATMAKPWRCRIRLHRYQRLRNPEGGWYRECRECGKQRNVPGSPPSMAGPG